MPSLANQIVEQVSSKERNTRFGMKKAYSFKAGGQWFNTGFTNTKVAAGDCISFDFTVGSYGNDVEVTSISKGTPSPNAVTSGGATGNRPTVPSGGKGVFPIPALDGQRAIVRQNALTNARELYVAFMQDTSGELSFGRKSLDLSTAVNQIVEAARIFEAYSCGDSDLEEAAKEVEAELQKAA